MLFPPHHSGAANTNIPGRSLITMYRPWLKLMAQATGSPEAWRTRLFHALTSLVSDQEGVLRNVGEY